VEDKLSSEIGSCYPCLIPFGPWWWPAPARPDSLPQSPSPALESRLWCSTSGRLSFHIHGRPSWGLEDKIWAGGDEVEWRVLATTTLSKAASGSLIDVGYRTTSESAVLSPTRPAAVPQDHLETVLLDHLRGLATAHVELGVTVEDVWEAQTRLRLKLGDGGSGASRILQTRYLIHADGARSVVTQRLGIRASVTEDLLEALSVVIRAPLWEVVGTATGCT
jgi:putative polyketide hydroxylase